MSWIVCSWHDQDGSLFAKSNADAFTSVEPRRTACLCVWCPLVEIRFDQWVLNQRPWTYSAWFSSHESQKLQVHLNHWIRCYWYTSHFKHSGSWTTLLCTCCNTWYESCLKQDTMWKLSAFASSISFAALSSLQGTWEKNMSISKLTAVIYHAEIQQGHITENVVKIQPSKVYIGNSGLAGHMSREERPPTFCTAYESKSM